MNKYCDTIRTDYQNLGIVSFCLIVTSEKDVFPSSRKNSYIFVKSKLISLYAFTGRNSFFQVIGIWLVYLLKEIGMLLYLDEQDTCT